MATLEEIVRRRKLRASPFGLEAESVRATLKEIAEDAVMGRLPALLSELKKEVLEKTQIYLEEKMPFYKGEKGDAVVGPSGIDGKDSTIPGPKGKVGKDSTIPGPPGSPGVPGKNGSPDDPQDIAKKVNTLTEAINLTVLKGWKKWSDSIQRAIAMKEKGGSAQGGGMGNIQHEHTAVSSVTTTVTTTYKVAG